MRRRSGLTLRLVLSHLLVIVVVLGIAGAALLTQSRRYFINADRRAQLIQARAAAAACDTLCVVQGRAEVGMRNTALPSGAVVSQNRNVSEANTRVEGLTQRIQTELTSTLAIVRQGSVNVEPSVATALRGTEASRVSGRSLVAAVPIRSGRSVIGAAVVRGDLGDVESVLGDLRRALFLVLAASAVVASIIGYLRARTLARPIRELTIAAQAISDGDFDRQMPIGKGMDELAVLTSTFTSMRDRVRYELATRAAFVADASHELRTPLTAIRGSVEVLEDGGAEDPVIRARFLASLRLETNRLLGLVNGLLDLDAGDHVRRHEPVDIGKLAASVVEQLGSENVLLDVHSDSPVIGDRDQLRQVLVNLIDNARTHGGMNIVVRVHSDAEECVVEVTDDGPGIDPVDRERVFERFVRLDRSRQRVGAGSSGMADRLGGSGLGLAIVRAIVASHEGSVALCPGPDGTGTTARLTLPARRLVPSAP